jgi:hypothetical protein
MCQATFEDAMKICEYDGMAMLTLESTEEATRIKEYISYIGKKE